MESFEKNKDDPNILVCTICQSKLSKGSIRSHLKTKKHLNARSTNVSLWSDEPKSKKQKMSEEYIETTLTHVALRVPHVNFLPLRPKLLKSLQNEGIFPLITMNVLIYASNLIN